MELSGASSNHEALNGARFVTRRPTAVREQFFDRDRSAKAEHGEDRADQVLMELAGFEPATFRLRTERSTN